jgi:hypothetical protein
MDNTPQGGTIEGNAVDDALLVDQGKVDPLTQDRLYNMLRRNVFGGRGE